eukprot:scaffold237497_cov58-Attheya_sp.AAC.2
MTMIFSSMEFASSKLGGRLIGVVIAVACLTLGVYEHRVEHDEAFMVYGVRIKDKNERNAYRMQVKSRAVQRLKGVQQDSYDPPGIVQLLSFPNSGTTYTLATVSQATQHCTSSQAKTELLVNPESPNGPYYHKKCDPRFDLPKKYVLNKSHCLTMSKYRESYKLTKERDNPLLFQDACHIGSSSGQDFNYDLSLIKKTVHLIRNPFDNVVSRFRYSWNKDHEHNLEDAYEKTNEGFHEFCSLHNEIYSTEHQNAFVKPEHKDLISKVPCAGEFFRYIIWHNQAIKMIKKTKAPSINVYYEDYNEKFDETMDTLLSFLEEEQVADPSSFFWHDYPEYYDEEARKAAAILMKEWATKDTWALIQHYMEPHTMSETATR